MHVLRPGDGVFESLKVDDGRAFAVEHHLDRLLASAAALGIEQPGRDELRDAVHAGARTTRGPSRMRVTLSVTGAGHHLDVRTAPRGPRAPAAHVVTTPWRRNERSPWAGHKATAYVDDVVAQAHAREAGADEAVLANLAGDLCEGTTSNVFYVVGGELRTPALSTGCLPGVTRALVLEWFGAREVAEPIEAVGSADEVFLTSTTRDVQPVHRWDERALATGPVTAAVLRAWSEHQGATADGAVPQRS